MSSISLPDQSVQSFEHAPSVFEIAQAIAPQLAQAALAGLVDGQLVDLSQVIHHDASVDIVTAAHPAALPLMRHSCAHLLAMAVKQLFPAAQLAIGPVIEDGFHYDFACEHPFSMADLDMIEARMRQLIEEDLPIHRHELSREAALAFFGEQREPYKQAIIADLPADEVLTLYQQGGFADLCRGPHLPSTGRIGAFKLLHVAGAYWRGDARNPMLQRIYGTCWPSQAALDAYLHQQAEAAKRDHRKLGAKLDWFHFQDNAPGAVFWHPKGWTVFQQLLAYMRQRHDAEGYVEVNTPDVMDRSLWEISGHWHNYRDHMFTTQTDDARVFALKPMNCPGAISLFAHGLRSYRELPLRMAEFGKVHRYEPSGALHGLMRVRHFTQDDAHIFCTLPQMEAECRQVIRLILAIYQGFGFADVVIRLSTRPANRIGDDQLWDRLEAALSSALGSLSLPYSLSPGEGAFYGPKLEFILKDAIGRAWQCGTLQVDLNLPERFDVHYVAEDGNKQRPVMLHRALFGSLERFIGILLEHHAGALPAWLAPVQVAVLTISEHQADYARQQWAMLKAAGCRAELDLRNEKIGFKIREKTLEKVPYLVIVGDQEKATGQVAVRTREGIDLGRMSLAALITQLCEARPQP
ncbi:threonyl-tRNA synthetase [Chitinivorax tropicus]|uniref:Threonine--tRNA ligase n=1 Tax=Chitinivorax tropicus TaxID=714531 RepID=A0A840MKP8_9PROT|nr:threonine--tRNA ligase [Chitinivorax tropicus]MBB5018990.1 threonyl-tRNA synthetase [Chitinivorax tropicus]